MWIKKLILFVFVCLIGQMASAQDGWHRLYNYADSEIDTVFLVDATTTPDGFAALSVAIKDGTSTMIVAMLDKKGDIKWTQGLKEPDNESYITYGHSITYNSQLDGLDVYINTNNNGVDLYKSFKARFEINGTLESFEVISDAYGSALLYESTYNDGTTYVTRTKMYGDENTVQEIQILKNDAKIEKTIKVFLVQVQLAVNQDSKEMLITGKRANGDVAFIRLDSVAEIMQGLSYSAEAGKLYYPSGLQLSDTTAVYAANTDINGYVWMVDTIGEPLWARQVNIKGASTRILSVKQNSKDDIVISGTFKDGANTKSFAMAIDTTGLPSYLSVFKNDISFFNPVHTEVNPQNGGIIIFKNAVNSRGDLTAGIINMDKDGVAMCSESIDTDTLLWANIQRDTLALENSDGSWFSDSLKVDAQPLTFYDIPILSIAPEKTQFCIGEEVNELLEAKIPGVPDSLQTHKWSTGETIDSIRATETDKLYKVEVTVNYETCYLQCDSILLTRYPKPQGEIQPTFTSGCSADLKVAVIDGKGPYKIQWDNGSTDNTISITEEKTYTVTFTDECGQTGEASIGIKFPELSADISQNTIKPCEQFRLDARVVNQSNPVTYSWSTGETTESINVTADGTYTVTVKDACDKEATASIEVVIGKPVTDFSVQNKVVCGEGNAPSTVTFSVSTVGGDYKDIRLINKKDSSTTTNINATLPLSNYTIEIEDFCGNKLTKDVIIAGQCGGCLKYPAVFFPNGTVDEEKSFGAVDLCGGTDGISDYDFRIYNRWGQEVFKTDKVTGTWNGKIGSSDAPSEVYVYYARYTLDGEVITDKGDVTIIR